MQQSKQNYNDMRVKAKLNNNNGARARTYCKYCNDYFNTEVFEKHRCTSLPETLF